MPPSPPVIYDDHDIPLSSLVGPFHLGSNISLKCISRGGHPLPILVWTRDQLTLNTSYQVSQEPGQVIATSQLLLFRWWPTRPSCSPLCQSCIYKTSGGELITIVSIWMKHQSDLKLLNWCQLFTELCPGRMMGQCSSVWPTARLATSLWSSKWSWMSSVSI